MKKDSNAQGAEEKTVFIEDIEALQDFYAVESTPYPPDPNSTWVYWSESDTEEQGIMNEWIWERLRIRRNFLLGACDYRVVMDAPWDVQPWMDYRQTLRDLPKNTVDPRLAVWPIAP